MQKLNRFNQDDINQAIESFDESYAQLKYIYTSILEFSSPKTGIEMKKVLQDFINIPSQESRRLSCIWGVSRNFWH